MLLRRVTQHVQNQNWFAVSLDFLIVVFGVYIGLQVQDWAVEKNRLSSERQYLERLHDEVEQLAMTREMYDQTRTQFSQVLFEIIDILNAVDQEITLTDEQCRIITHSSFTTIPPAELPSATELISSGRLDQIASPALRDSILSYVQDAARVRDLITLLNESNIDLSRIYPNLLQTKVSHTDYKRDSIGLSAKCNANELRANQAFMNDFSANAYMYIIYTERGVLEVSEKLAELHNELDTTLGINHPVKEVN
jgi:hypothetical protein